MPFSLALPIGCPFVTRVSPGVFKGVSLGLGYVGLAVSLKEIFLLPNLCDSVLFQIANIFVQIGLRNIAGIPLWYFKIFHSIKMPKRLVI